MRLSIISILFFSILSFQAFFSQLVYSNVGGAANVIVNSMLGGGVTVSNQTITCPTNAYGTFTNGATSNIGISSGIILSTGNINNLNGNGSAFWSSDLPGGNCNDPQLSGLENLATYDCCILEFDVVPTCTSLKIRFVFGSEEYPEFVNAGYNDAFGFFVTGPNPLGGPAYNNSNVATLPNNTTFVSIDNVNANNNSQYYTNNSTGTSIKLDAFTSVLTRTIFVTPCQTYHFKLAIADAGDGIYDSAVFIDFLECSNALTASTTTNDATCAGNDGTASVSASFGFPPYSYSWNTTPPQTTASITGLLPGTYQVTVDDAGDCTAPIVQTVTIGSNTNPPFLSINTPVLCFGDSGTLTATTGGGGTYLWSTGETTQSINVNPTVTTDYICTYDVGVCANVDTVTVVVTNPITPTFNQIPQVCQYTTSPLIPTSSTNAVPISGTWSPSSIDSNTPGILTYQFTPNADQCANPTSMDIEVIPEVQTLFNPINDVCEGTPSITLPTNSDNSPAISGTWDVPTLNTNAVGNYTFNFTPNVGVCASLATLNINVNQIPVVSTDATLEMCQGQSETFTTNVDLMGGTYLWSEGSTTASITVSPASTSTYSVTYTLNGCSSSDSGVLTVNPNIPVDAGQDVAICIGDSVALTASGTPTIVWAGGIQNGVYFSPTSTATYTVTGTSDNGCVTTDEVIVTINPLPIIDAGLPVTVCVGQPVVLYGSGANTYMWSNNVLDSVAFSPLQTNVYSVIGTDSNGCMNYDTVLVTVLPLPNANISASPLTGYAPLLATFTNTSTNSNSYVWDFGNGLSATTNNLNSVNSTYPLEQEYTIWLYASNGYCVDSEAVTISVLPKPFIDMPNVFSPNDDGTNELYFPFVRNLAELNLIIVNRWGNVMATITDPSGATGWNGLTDNGTPASEGVYFYSYQATGFQGEILEGHGFLTLIR